jgi:Ca2+-transporting ATPase
VGETTLHDNAWPSEQQLFTFRYLGLVAFQDPPKPDISRVFQHFGEAGIRTIIITGDDPDTAMAIARQVGFVINGDPVTGEHVQAMDDAALAITVQTRNLFTRMFPEAKLRVVLALKALGEVVAMTGDGVNDGPALKAAHIGIAMGRRGSELAKEAAALVLMDDDLGRMVDAVAQGRRIYGNLKKAIRYIITIHIPIILTVVLPLLFGWIYPNILTPLHVIFLELIMGPTCSIVFENEPLEPGSMSRGPRPRGRTFLTWVELRVSVLQGLHHPRHGKYHADTRGALLPSFHAPYAPVSQRPAPHSPAGHRRHVGAVGQCAFSAPLLRAWRSPVTGPWAGRCRRGTLCALV